MDKLMSDAYICALQSPCLHRHGAIGTINGKIIGKGYNHYYVPSNILFECKEGKSCHAEIDLLQRICKQYKINNIEDINKKKLFKKLKIYLIRITSGNNIMNSAPCFHCTKVLKKFNVKKIIYSKDDGTFYTCKVKDYRTNKITNGNVKYN